MYIYLLCKYLERITVLQFIKPINVIINLDKRVNTFSSLKQYNK